MQREESHSPRDHFCNPNSSAAARWAPWNLIGNTKGPPGGPLLWTAGPGRPDGGVRPWVGEAGPGEAQRIPRQPAGPGRASLGPGLHRMPWARGTHHRKVVAVDHQRPSSSEVNVLLPPVTYLSGAKQERPRLNQAARDGGGRRGLGEGAFTAFLSLGAKSAPVRPHAKQWAPEDGFIQVKPQLQGTSPSFHRWFKKKKKHQMGKK